MDGLESNPEPSTRGRRYSAVGLIGVVLGIVGLCGAFYFFAMFDTSVVVPDQEVLGETIPAKRVHNIGLIADRETGLAFLGLLTVVGMFLFVVRRPSAGPVRTFRLPRVRLSRGGVLVVLAALAATIVVLALTGVLTDLWIWFVLNVLLPWQDRIVRILARN